MQVDGDAAYSGEYDYNYYSQDNYFPYFANHLGMVCNFVPELILLEPNKNDLVNENSRHSKKSKVDLEIPKKVFKAHTEIAKALHEAMKCKPIST